MHLQNIKVWRLWISHPLQYIISPTIQKTRKNLCMQATRGKFTMSAHDRQVFRRQSVMEITASTNHCLCIYIYIYYIQVFLSVFKHLICFLYSTVHKIRLYEFCEALHSVFINIYTTSQLFCFFKDYFIANWKLFLTLTSVCDDPKVRSDDLHVDAMFLFSDDHCSPEASVVPILAHLSGSVNGICFRWCHRCVIWARTELCWIILVEGKH